MDSRTHRDDWDWGGVLPYVLVRRCINGKTNVLPQRKNDSIFKGISSCRDRSSSNPFA